MPRDTAITAPDPDYFYIPKTEARIIAKKMQLKQPILLSGPPGCGKSQLGEILARSILRQTAQVMTFHNELAKDDIWGSWTLENGSTRFCYSPLLWAMMAGIPVILNEVDAAPAESLFPLHAILDGREITIPFLKDPETGAPMRINPWRKESAFTVVATANTLGRGDHTGLYRGTRPLNEAFLDRFDVIRISYPPRIKEVGILVNRTGIHEPLAGKMVDIANLARNAQASGTVQASFSTRKALRWASAVAALGLSAEQGFCLSALEGARPEDAQALGEFYQRVFGQTCRRESIH